MWFISLQNYRLFQWYTMIHNDTQCYNLQSVKKHYKEDLLDLLAIALECWEWAVNDDYDSKFLCLSV